MNSNEKIKECLVQYLAQLRGTGIDQGEILYWETEMGTIRTFLNRISHNGFTHDAEIYVTSIRGKQMGQAQTTDLSKNGIQRAVRQVTDLARHATPFHSFPVLPGSYRDYSLTKKIFYDSTLQVSSSEKIKMIQKMIDISNENDLNCSAKMMTGGGKIGIINTSGTLMVTEFTEASLSLILTGGKTISAYSSGSSENIETLNTDQIIQEAIRNANRQRLPPVDPIGLKGKEFYFDLILGPYAVAEWMEILATIGLNGLRFEEGESFVSGRLNQRLLGENITLHDDGTDPRGFIAPFDFEGVPKTRQILFEHGVAKSVCYDTLLGEKYGKKTTGHALPPFERSYGAIPRHLMMEGGRSTLEEMIASSEEPTLYITRFHYTNVVNPKEGILTGMTKDGTFLVQNGKIAGPVSNLRYLESIPEALNRVTHLGESRLVHDPVGYGGLYPEGSVVPPLKIKKVRFIGTSQNLAEQA
jgi:predicted Zn-dependent protease